MPIILTTSIDSDFLPVVNNTGNGHREPSHDSGELGGIDPQVSQAAWLSYAEAIAILFSVGFGIGYISIAKDLFSDLTPMSYILPLLFYMGIGFICIYFLSDVKKEHKNKMGSYQEIAYYYVKNRSIIFAISTLYMIDTLLLCVIALHKASLAISIYI